MGLPYFFIDQNMPPAGLVELDEDTSRHVVQVLRMQAGAPLQLTDGKGNLATANITSAHKKHCTVTIQHNEFTERPKRYTAIAISLLKNTSRFEWFLEKATELGIQEIVPLICKRTEKEHFRKERMQGILVSAMLQSQQAWLPAMQAPVSIEEWINNRRQTDQMFIAHCEPDINKLSLRQQVSYTSSAVVAIGPEGDFTSSEIQLAIDDGFVPVSLGDTRLRTETAAIVAATILTV